ncbi:MAG: hydantoinase/oxoprolinase family protein [Isosphaeraceae bacterium]|nr:hydantoinase/oxoprolinase family protein [Isosphaeraceae bacterium]
MNENVKTWAAFDIGGANIKAAHSSAAPRSAAFELWKRPEGLAGMLEALVRGYPRFDGVLLTMTAELCDCFETKSEGVGAVIDAVESVAAGRPVRVWGNDGGFHRPEVARERPMLVAAANWLAPAESAARLIPSGPGILIDIGTTTTDLIPTLDGRVVARGRSDTQRMQTGELVYAGCRRTPICALATELPHRGVSTGISAELFATTHDVYLTLGRIAEDPTDRTTADGRPATREFARDRLARMIGADREEFNADDAVEFAAAAHEALLARLLRAAQVATSATSGRPAAAIVGGSGEFLARELATKLLPDGGAITGLAEVWGVEASRAACAVALLERIAEDEAEGSGGTQA